MTPHLGRRGAGQCADCGEHSEGLWPGRRCPPCWERFLAQGRARRHKGPTALYRLYNAYGYLLYIGITIDPKRRFKEHRKTMPWWPEVDSELTTIEWLDCGGYEAEKIELAAIQAEFPWYNRVGVDEPVAELWELPAGCPPHPWKVEYRSADGFWADWERWWAAARDCVLNPEERAARDSVRREAPGCP